MRHLTYLLVLACCLAGASWLELWPGTRVYRRWRRLLLALLPTVLVFTAWDLYAVARGHWHYDPAQIVGLSIGRLPVEELLFFVVTPTCAILSLEAVRRLTKWRVGPCLPPARSAARRPDTPSAALSSSPIQQRYRLLLRLASSASGRRSRRAAGRRHGR